MKKIYIFLIVLIVFAVLFFAEHQPATLIVINASESFYSDFEIKEEKVYIYCSLLIENKDDCEKKVELEALFEQDKLNGLLKDDPLQGFASDCETTQFDLVKGSNRIEVVFIGEHGGANEKHDRKLPQIQIIEVQ